MTMQRYKGFWRGVIFLIYFRWIICELGAWYRNDAPIIEKTNRGIRCLFAPTFFFTLRERDKKTRHPEVECRVLLIALSRSLSRSGGTLSREGW